VTICIKSSLSSDGFFFSSSFGSFRFLYFKLPIEWVLHCSCHVPAPKLTKLPQPMCKHISCSLIGWLPKLSFCHGCLVKYKSIAVFHNLLLLHCPFPPHSASFCMRMWFSAFVLVGACNSCCSWSPGCTLPITIPSFPFPLLVGKTQRHKVDARFLDFYYMSNTFTGDLSVICDSSTECDSGSDIDYKSQQKKQRADHAPHNRQGNQCLTTKEKG